MLDNDYQSEQMKRDKYQSNMSNRDLMISGIIAVCIVIGIVVLVFAFAN